METLTPKELRQMSDRFRELTDDADQLEEAIETADVEKIERYAASIIDNARDIHEAAEAALNNEPA